MHTARAHILVHEVIPTVVSRRSGTATAEQTPDARPLLDTDVDGKRSAYCLCMLLDANVLMNIYTLPFRTYVRDHNVNPVAVTLTKSLGTPSPRLPYQFETG